MAGLVDFNCDINLTSPDGLPVRCLLSFAPLIEYLSNITSIGAPALDAVRRKIVEEAMAIPDLQRPITDPDILAKHEPMLRNLMSLIFPSYMGQNVSFAAILPFQPHGFWASELFAKRFLDDKRQFRGRPLAEKSTMLDALVATILTKAYGLPIPGRRYLELFESIDPDTKLPLYQQLSLDLTHCRALLRNGAPKISQQVLHEALGLMSQPVRALGLLPVADITIEGFAIVRTFDVTVEESFARLQSLIEQLDRPKNLPLFAQSQQQIRVMCQDAKIEIALLAAGDSGWLRITSDDKKRTSACGFGTYFPMCPESQLPLDFLSDVNKDVQVLDLASSTLNHSIYAAYRAQGFQSVVYLRLKNGQESLGFLEILSSHNRPDLVYDMESLQQVAGLFAAAVMRINYRTAARIESFIKEHCTAVHPSVEWRFRQAAMQWFDQRSQNKALPMQDIVFDHVYPLYAICDIRGSSKLRAAAIKEDLLATLAIFSKIFRAALSISDLPLIRLRMAEMQGIERETHRGMSSGAEIAAFHYMRDHLEPLLSLVAGMSAEVDSLVSAYQREVQKSPHGTIDHGRLRFDQSVAALNLALSRYLDEEQEKAQKVFPHYFEKHVTDGIDHSIYIGKSLVPNREFHSSYVENLRLWQLNLSCGLARIAHQVGGQLPVPLKTSQLIVAQETAMAIEFRYDEKRFDVRGAYNIRYELIKKRIDKATVANSGERLTEPGTVSVVYSQESERREYEVYMQHLSKLGVLSGSAEILALDELQDVSGLHALRGKLSQEFLAAKDETAQTIWQRVA